MWGETTQDSLALNDALWNWVCALYYHPCCACHYGEQHGGGIPMKTHYTVALSMIAGAALGAAAIQGLHAQAKLRRPRSFEQNFRVDMWNVCRGYAATRNGSFVK